MLRYRTRIILANFHKFLGERFTIVSRITASTLQLPAIWIGSTSKNSRIHLPIFRDSPWKIWHRIAEILPGQWTTHRMNPSTGLASRCRYQLRRVPPMRYPIFLTYRSIDNHYHYQWLSSDSICPSYATVLQSAILERVSFAASSVTSFLKLCASNCASSKPSQLLQARTYFILSRDLEIRSCVLPSLNLFSRKKIIHKFGSQMTFIICSGL